MSLPSINVLIQVAVIGLLTGGVYAVMVSGLTLIFGVMKIINIAHAAFMVLSAYLAYWLFSGLGIDPILSMIGIVPLFFFIGKVTQRRVLSPVGDDPGLLVLLTFALAITLEGVLGSISGSTFRTVRTGYTSSIIPVELSSDLTLRLPVVRLTGFVASFVVLGVLWLILNRSGLGRAIRATIQNAEAAQLVGVNIARVRSTTFGIGLASVAIGGALFSLIFSFNGSSHLDWISKMLAIIVLGGLGSLPGALIAALILGVAEAVSAVTMTSYISPIVFYLILFLTLVFRPQGLMGAKVREG